MNKNGNPKEDVWNVMLVGAGAIGCEILKSLAYLNRTIVVHLIDPDVIENSNLNRQLLFRYNIFNVSLFLSCKSLY